jgi:hypothetical protein
MNPNDLGCPQECPDILWILKMIKHEQKVWLASLLRKRKAIRKLNIWVIATLKRHALMIHIAQALIELLTINPHNCHALFFG